MVSDVIDGDEIVEAKPIVVDFKNIDSVDCADAD